MDTQKTQKSFVIAIVLIIVVVALLIFSGAFSAKKDSPEKSGNPLGIQTSEAPWIAEIDHLSERLDSIGLPALAEEGTTLHIHQHLDIFIHGKAVAVPAGIGINEQARYISPLHTHDTTGVIHVESPTVQDFTLGQFFDVWGVLFNSQAIGGYAADASDTLKVFVNGKEFFGDPRTIVLAAHQEIVVAYGTSSELPNPIQDAYTFEAGE